MMSVKEYAQDTNCSIAEILKKCEELGIDVKSGTDELSEDDIIMLDNTINLISTDKETTYEEEDAIDDVVQQVLESENIDKTTKNKAVRLNLKINTLEKNLTKVNEELELMKILNLDKDKSKREQLSKFKAYLELQITSLKAEKKRFGVFERKNR